MPNDNLTQYYEYLKGAGADVPPTVESFEKTLRNEANAKTYYTYLRDNGFDAPDTYESFRNTLLGVKKKEPSVTGTTVTSPSESQLPSGEGKTGGEAIAGTRRRGQRTPPKKTFLGKEIPTTKEVVGTGGIKIDNFAYDLSSRGLYEKSNEIINALPSKDAWATELYSYNLRKLAEEKAQSGNLKEAQNLFTEAKQNLDDAAKLYEDAGINKPSVYSDRAEYNLATGNNVQAYNDAVKATTKTTQYTQQGAAETPLGELQAQLPNLGEALRLEQIKYQALENLNAPEEQLRAQKEELRNANNAYYSAKNEVRYKSWLPTLQSEDMSIQLASLMGFPYSGTAKSAGQGMVKAIENVEDLVKSGAVARATTGTLTDKDLSDILGFLNGAAGLAFGTAMTVKPDGAIINLAFNIEQMLGQTGASRPVMQTPSFVAEKLGADLGAEGSLSSEAYEAADLVWMTVLFAGMHNIKTGKWTNPKQIEQAKDIIQKVKENKELTPAEYEETLRWINETPKEVIDNSYVALKEGAKEYDSKNKQGVSGQVGEGQELVEGQPNVGTGKEAVGDGGVVQEIKIADISEKPASEIDINLLTEDVIPEIEARAKERLIEIKPDDREMVYDAFQQSLENNPTKIVREVLDDVLDRYRASDGKERVFEEVKDEMISEPVNDLVNDAVNEGVSEGVKTNIIPIEESVIPEKGYEISAESVNDAVYDMKKGLGYGLGTPESASGYKTIGDAVIRVKDHSPEWAYFRDEIENNGKKKIINVTVGEGESQMRGGAKKTSIEEIKNEYPDVEFYDIVVKDGENIRSAIERVYTEINDILSTKKEAKAELVSVGKESKAEPLQTGAESKVIPELESVEATANALVGKESEIAKKIGKKVFRGQEKGKIGRWFTASRPFAEIFAKSARGGKRIEGEVIESSILGNVLDFPYVVTEYAKISDKLAEIFGVTQNDIRNAIAKTDEALSKGEIIRIHSLLENKGFQELLKSKGIDYIKAKENLTKNEKVDTFLKISDKTNNQLISEAYHKAKADGSNPELVKAVEDLLSGTKKPVIEIKTEPQGVGNETQKPKSDGLQKEKGEEGVLKETGVETPPSTIDRVAGFLDSLKVDTKDKTFDASLGIPIAAWNASIDVIKASIKAGKVAYDAITDAIDYLKRKGITFDEYKYRKTYEDAFSKGEAVLKKEVAAGLKKKSDDIEYEFFGSVTESPKGKGNIILKTIGLPQRLQEATFSKAFGFLGDKLAKVASKGMVSQNKYLGYVIRTFSKAAQSLFKVISKTSEEAARADEFIGSAKDRPLKDAKVISDKLRDMLKDPNEKSGIIQSAKMQESLNRIDRVIDEDFYRERTREEFEENLRKEYGNESIDRKSTDEIDSMYAEYRALMGFDEPGYKEITYKDLTPQEQIVADAIKKIYDFTHDSEFVSGIIGQDVYAYNKGKYSARFYEKFEMPEDMTEMLKQSGLKMDLSGGKARGELTNWKAQYKIKDPIYGVTKRLLGALANKAVFEYSAYLKNKGISSSFEKPGYVQLNGRQYGELNKQYVPKQVAEEFRGTFYTNAILQGLYDVFSKYDRLGIRQFQKGVLTRWNPAVRAGNYTGNIIFAGLMGVDPLTFNINLNTFARNEVKTYGSTYRYLLSKGILSSDITRADIADSMKNYNESLMGKKGNVLKEFNKWVNESYQRVDDLAKIAAFKSLIDMGLTNEQAIRRVSNGMQNSKRIGKAYDYAAKTPIVGNPFSRFKGDMMRLLPSTMANTPLNVAGFAAALHATANIASILSGESESDRKIREGRTGFPKIAMPDWLGGDIPLAFKMGKDELNVARFLSPYYIYSTVDDDDVYQSIMKLSPYSFDTDKRTQNPEGKWAVFAAKNAQDPLFAGLVQWIVNSDFKGMPITDKDISKWSPNSSLSKKEQAINQMRYLIRSYAPYGQFGDDLFRAMSGEEDYYGRERSPLQVTLRFLGYNSQTFSDDRYNKTLVKSIMPDAVEFVQAGRFINEDREQFATGKISEKVYAERMIEHIDRAAYHLSRVKKAMDDGGDRIKKVNLVEKLDDASFITNVLLDDIQDPKGTFTKEEYQKIIDETASERRLKRNELMSSPDVVMEMKKIISQKMKEIEKRRNKMIERKKVEK